jgi:hypothetical protein
VMMMNLQLYACTLGLCGLGVLYDLVHLPQIVAGMYIYIYLSLLMCGMLDTSADF